MPSFLFFSRNSDISLTAPFLTAFSGNKIYTGLLALSKLHSDSKGQIKLWAAGDQCRGWSFIGGLSAFGGLILFWIGRLNLYVDNYGWGGYDFMAALAGRRIGYMTRKLILISVLFEGS